MEKEITVTPERILEAVSQVTSGKSMQAILKKAPVLSLAFTLFGAELVRILFNIKEDTK